MGKNFHSEYKIFISQEILLKGVKRNQIFRINKIQVTITPGLTIKLSRKTNPLAWRKLEFSLKIQTVNFIYFWMPAIRYNFKKT